MKRKRKRRAPLSWQQGSDGWVAFTPANGVFIVDLSVGGWYAKYVAPSREPGSIKLLGRFATAEHAMAYCDMWWRAGRLA